MRLIDADRLKEHFSWWTNPDGTDTEQKKLFNTIIDKQPIIEIVLKTNSIDKDKKEKND